MLNSALLIKQGIPPKFRVIGNSSAGGRAVPDREWYTVGEEVRVRLIGDNHYKPTGATATGVSGSYSGDYFRFTMPPNDVYVTGSFTKKNTWSLYLSNDDGWTDVSVTFRSSRGKNQSFNIGAYQSEFIRNLDINEGVTCTNFKDYYGLYKSGSWYYVVDTINGGDFRLY